MIQTVLSKPISCGTKLAIFGSKRDRVLVQLYTEWNFCILKLTGLRRLSVLTPNAKMLLLLCYYIVFCGFPLLELASLHDG